MTPIEKVIRFPWGIPNGAGVIENKLDREIWIALETLCGFDPIYKTKPTHGKTIPMAALPTIMFMIHNKMFEQYKEPNPWKTVLSDKERQEVLDYYYLSEQSHLQLYQFMQNYAQSPFLTAYMAGIFAFTTRAVPLMVRMDDIVHEINESTFGDTPLLEEINNAGLLIVTSPVGMIKGFRNSVGSLYSLFRKRMDLRRITVFVDGCRQPIKDLLEKEKVIERHAVMQSFKKTELEQNMLSDLLAGQNTYIAIQDAERENMRVLNECRITPPL